MLPTCSGQPHPILSVRRVSFSTHAEVIEDAKTSLKSPRKTSSVIISKTELAKQNCFNDDQSIKKIKKALEKERVTRILPEFIIKSLHEWYKSQKSSLKKANIQSLKSSDIPEIFDSLRGSLCGLILHCENRINRSKIKAIRRLKRRCDSIRRFVKTYSSLDLNVQKLIQIAIGRESLSILIRIAKGDVLILREMRRKSNVFLLYTDEVNDLAKKLNHKIYGDQFFKSQQIDKSDEEFFQHILRCLVQFDRIKFCSVYSSSVIFGNNYREEVQEDRLGCLVGDIISRLLKCRLFTHLPASSAVETILKYQYDPLIVPLFFLIPEKSLLLAKLLTLFTFPSESGLRLEKISHLLPVHQIDVFSRDSFQTTSLLSFSIQEHVNGDWIDQAKVKFIRKSSCMYGEPFSSTETMQITVSFLKGINSINKRIIVDHWQAVSERAELD